MRSLALTPLLFASLVATAQVENPDVNAASAIVMDAETGQVLFVKNKDVRHFPASTTKIMTGLLLAEKCDPKAKITAPSDVKNTKESSMHLEPGEQLSVRDMLYAMMLRSANDGCHAVAVHIAGSEAKFAELMNAKASELGCKNTHFVNPHGLHNAQHYTTAYDLALMGSEAMKNPLFSQVVGTQKYVVARSLNQKDTLMVNRDKWLTLEPAARGIKTGWTKPAGHCFVGCFEREGLKVVTAVMDSSDWLFDQQVLTAWTLDNFEKGTVFASGDTVASVTVEGGEVQQVDLVAVDAVELVVPRGENQPWPVDPASLPTIAAPVSTDAEYSVKLSGPNGSTRMIRVRPRIPVAKRLSASNVVLSGSGAMGVALLGGGAMLARARSRRMAQGFMLK
ncbi:MAG: D-alanyl-D-alanine carboxypeptidase [Armatimonadetes bacterium]|nr:D-alanyl-D-alanine carboxypeptidase [Armatimonadota bacterium]